MVENACWCWLCSTWSNLCIGAPPPPPLPLPPPPPPPAAVIFLEVSPFAFVVVQGRTVLQLPMERSCKFGKFGGSPDRAQTVDSSEVARCEQNLLLEHLIPRKREIIIVVECEKKYLTARSLEFCHMFSTSNFLGWELYHIHTYHPGCCVGPRNYLPYLAECLRCVTIAECERVWESGRRK